MLMEIYDTTLPSLGILRQVEISNTAKTWCMNATRQFIANVERLAEERGLSLSAVMKKAGVNRTLLSPVKSGKTRSITVEKAEMIAAAFDEPLWKLLAPPDDVEKLSSYHLDREYIRDIALYVLEAFGVEDEEEVAGAIEFFAWNYRKPEMRQSAAQLRDAIRSHAGVMRRRAGQPDDAP